MNLFEAVKAGISTRQAAERYGIEVKRNSMACCPFHQDHTPSMKLDKRFHCFGCGSDGYVIDFTALLFGLQKKEAAIKLAQDFGLAYDSRAPPLRIDQQKSDAQIYKETEHHCFRVLAAYFHLLLKWRRSLAPISPQNAWHPQFVESLQMLACVENLLDFFIDGSIAEKAGWIVEHGKDVIKLEQRLSKLTAESPGSSYADSSLHESTQNHRGGEEATGFNRKWRNQKYD